jgi:hypothetical protein
VLTLAAHKGRMEQGMTNDQAPMTNAFAVRALVIHSLVIGIFCSRHAVIRVSHCHTFHQLDLFVAADLAV